MSDSRMREPTEAERADLLDKLGCMKGHDDAVEFKKPAGLGCGSWCRLHKAGEICGDFKLHASRFAACKEEHHGKE